MEKSPSAQDQVESLHSELNDSTESNDSSESSNLEKLSEASIEKIKEIELLPGETITSDDVKIFVTEGVQGFDYSEKSLRRDLLRKVYGIVLLQVLFTFTTTFLATYHESVNKVFRENMSIMLAFELIAVALTIVVTVSKKLRRKHPLNLYVLFVITLGFALAVGSICSILRQQIVLKAVAATAVVWLVLTFFIFITRINFFGHAPYLLVVILALFMIHVLLIFSPREEMMFSIFTPLGVLVFSWCIIFHTQILLGPHSLLNLFAEDHVFIALTLYTDILNLFLKLIFVV